MFHLQIDDPLFFSGSLLFVSFLEWRLFFSPLNTEHSFYSQWLAHHLQHYCFLVYSVSQCMKYFFHLHFFLALWTSLEQNLLPHLMVFLYEMWQNFSELERHWSQCFSCWLYEPFLSQRKASPLRKISLKATMEYKYYKGRYMRSV